MIKAVFFDLYGTLFLFGDMNKAWSDWLSVFYLNLKKYGLSITFNEFSILCDQFMEKEEPQFIEKDLTLYEKRIKRLTEELHLNVPDNQIKQISNLTLDAWNNEIHLDPDVHNVLKELSNNKVVGLVSNFDHPPYVYKYLKEYNLEQYFNFIIISAEEGIKKPDPAIFRRAFTEFDLQPEEAIFIGDSYEDMEAAKGAGIHFIYIRHENEIESIYAKDYKVDNDIKDWTFPENARTIRRLTDIIEIVN